MNASKWDSVIENQTLNHKKSLMFKYGRMQRKIPSRLLCGSHGAYLDCMLPGVQVTTGLLHLSVSEDSDFPLL